MRQNDPDFDRELEHALAAYADPCDAGQPHVLTHRVIARVEKAQKQRRWKLAFIFVIPEFALLLLWIVFLLPHHPKSMPAEIGNNTSAAVTPPTVAAVRPSILTPGHVPPPHTHAVSAEQKRTPLPKLDQFPAPAPPTEQEKLLMAFSESVPADAQQSIAELQPEPKPLRIAELKIPAIDSGTPPCYLTSPPILIDKETLCANHLSSFSPFCLPSGRCG
jgi:hypothetical protein